MAQNLFRQGMFICGTKFIMLRLKNWQNLKRYSCVTRFVWKLSKIFTIATKKGEKLKQYNEQQIQIDLSKTIETYPGSASNI